MSRTSSGGNDAHVAGREIPLLTLNRTEKNNIQSFNNQNKNKNTNNNNNNPYVMKDYIATREEGVGDSLLYDENTYYGYNNNYYYANEDAAATTTNNNNNIMMHSPHYYPWRRFLASAAPVNMDFSVLSVAVFTLMIIMFVEFCRHFLDHCAKGKPFFKHMMETLYQELTTLAIVEVGVWLVIKFHTNIDFEKERVFADVHYCLFFTAIFNALQTFLLAIISFAISRRKWVQTESLELDHYVELREEFDRCKAELKRLKLRRIISDSEPSDDVVEKFGADGNHDVYDLELQPNDSMKSFKYTSFSLSCEGLRNLVKGFMDLIRFPGLKRKHNELLVQVRYHELRVHFLQSQQLPLKLKISDYLLRSQVHVLIKLVHINTATWILLTGVFNLLYYLMGIVVTYSPHNPNECDQSQSVEYTLTFLYFVSMLFCVIAAIVAYGKMTNIFETIMHRPVLWKGKSNDNEQDDYNEMRDEGGLGSNDTREKKDENLVENQLSLFWGKDPKYVIVAIQMMNHIYAIYLAIFIVFPQFVVRSPFSERAASKLSFFIVWLVSYAIFVYVVSIIIPQYTLCTSLGQLVDKKRLDETVALYHLETARRQQYLAKYQEEPFNNSDEEFFNDDKQRSSRSTVQKPVNAIRNVWSGIVQSQNWKKSAVSDTVSSNASSIKSLDLDRFVPSNFTRRKSSSDGVAIKSMRSANLSPSAQDFLEGKSPSPRVASSDRSSRNSFAGFLQSHSFSPTLLRSTYSQPLNTESDYGNDDTSGSKPMHPEASNYEGSVHDRNVIPLSLPSLEQMKSNHFEVSDTTLASPKDRRSRRRHIRTKSKSDSSAIARMVKGDGGGGKAQQHEFQRDSLMAEMVTTMDTGSLRTKLPFKDQEKLLQREKERIERRKPRQKRLKSLSDGTAAMAAFTSPSQGANVDLTPKLSADDLVLKFPTEQQDTVSSQLSPDRLNSQDSQRKERRRSRRARMKAISDGVALMARADGGGGKVHQQEFQRDSLMAEMVTTMDTGSLRTKLPVKDQERLLKREKDRYKRRKPRQKRLKSLSEGAAAMAAFTSPSQGENTDLTPKPSPAEDLQTIQEESSKNLIPPKPAFSSNAIHSEKGTGNTAAAPALALPKKFVTLDEKETDDASIESVLATSDEAGYNSDADDVPEADKDLFLLNNCPHSDTGRIHTSKYTLSDFFEFCKWYYISDRYIVISNLFGTMVVFFMIGLRVDGFLHSEGIISDEVGFFVFGGDTWLFWLIACWMIMFEISACIIFLLFRPFHHLKTLTERKVVAAAVIDFVITSVCLTVFFVAEAERCCYSPTGNPNMRELAGEAYSQKLECQLPAPCSCPVFGSREYGGLGKIEPYVALIALRVFRHWLGARIVRYLDSKRGWSASNEVIDDMKSGKSLRTNPLAVFSSSRNQTNSKIEEERGTIVQLWQSSLVQHPDIVAAHGEFSGELLQAMLGVLVVSGQEEKGEIYSTPNSADDHKLLGLTTNEIESGEKRGATSTISPDKRQIVTGQRHPLSSRLSTSTPDMMGISEHAMAVGSATAFPAHKMRKSRSMIGLSGNDDNDFIAPGARLARSMRRCHRKFLPMLDKWTIVDVVITRFEIVYFDASDDVDGKFNSEMEATREAIVTSKGGKGLRLCDVAVGRRVVGHLLFSDIISAHVERVLPNNQSLVSGMDENGDGSKEVKTEYWQKCHHTCREDSRDRAWLKIKQDRLKIQTVHNHVLYLRFFSDLEDAQLHLDRLNAETEETGPLYKNNAFQWVQTIGRFCGPEHLEEPLPHFGEDTSDELRDYLIVDDNDHHEFGAGKRHRRNKLSSGGDVFRRLARPTPPMRSQSLSVASGSSDVPPGQQQSSSRHRRVDFSLAQQKPEPKKPVSAKLAQQKPEPKKPASAKF